MLGDSGPLQLLFFPSGRVSFLGIDPAGLLIFPWFWVSRFVLGLSAKALNLPELTLDVILRGTD
jgi:hypothetical protein